MFEIKYCLIYNNNVISYYSVPRSSCMIKIPGLIKSVQTKFLDF